MSQTFMGHKTLCDSHKTRTNRQHWPSFSHSTWLFKCFHRKFPIIAQIFFHKCETNCTDDMKTIYWGWDGQKRAAFASSHQSGWNKTLASPSYSFLLIVTWLRADDQWWKDCCRDTQLLRLGFFFRCLLFWGTAPWPITGQLNTALPSAGRLSWMNRFASMCAWLH